MKTCTKCKETKPLSEFDKNKRSKDNHHTQCKACRKASKKVHYQANKARLSEKQKAYYKDNRDARIEYAKAYYVNNKDVIADQRKTYHRVNKLDIAKKKRDYRESHRVQIDDQVRAWRQANPGKVSSIRQRYRASKVDAPGFHTAEQWQARLDYFCHKCRYCGSRDNIECEHQIPLSRGGSNWPSNLAPACKSCNCSKGTKTHLEFLRELSDGK